MDRTSARPKRVFVSVPRDHKLREPQRALKRDTRASDVMFHRLAKLGVSLLVLGGAVACGNGGPTDSNGGEDPRLPQQTAQPGVPDGLSIATADLTRRRAAADSDAGVSADQLFDWAEDLYHDLFPTREVTLSLAPYLYRYYPKTDLYLGVADGSVLLMSPTTTQGALVNVGPVSLFAPRVQQYASELPRNVTVPIDLDRVQYPQSYQTPTRSQRDISTDPCRLDLEVVSYPQTWMGTLTLPAVRGAPLPASFGRGMKIKDIMLSDNPAFVLPGAPGAPDGCKGSLRTEFDRTLVRLRKLGVDHVEIPQWHWTSRRADGSWYWVRAEDSFGPLPDADLAYFVDRAHQAGLKVIVRNASLGMVDNPVGDGAAYVPPPTIDNLTRWFAAYQAFIAERAGFFQSIGIDAWELTCSTCMYHDDGDGSAAARALTAAEYDKALKTIRTTYKGLVFASVAPWLLDRPEVMKQVDFLMTGLWFNRFSEAQAQALTVDDFKAALESSGAAGSLRYLSRFGRPLIVQADWVQSRRNLLTLPGYMEETVCTSSIGDLNPSGSICIQKETSPDFAQQAIIFEALLETVAANLTVPGSIVLAGEYWVTDPLLPATAYPNLSASPRNKPAEGLLKAWFRR